MPSIVDIAEQACTSRQFEAWYLAEIEEWPLARIAETMKIKLDTLDDHLWAARKRIELFQREHPSDEPLEEPTRIHCKRSHEAEDRSNSPLRLALRRWQKAAFQRRFLQGKEKGSESNG